MKLQLKLLPLLILPSLLFANAPTLNITNGTGCLEPADGSRNLVGEKPVTIYVFTKDAAGKYDYSGVSVAPGQTAAVPTVPTGLPAQPNAVLLGTDPHDMTTHITTNIPTNLDTTVLIDQSATQQPGNGCSNPNYPCVSFAIFGTNDLCVPGKVSSNDQEH